MGLQTLPIDNRLLNDGRPSTCFLFDQKKTQHCWSVTPSIIRPSTVKSCARQRKFASLPALGDASKPWSSQVSKASTVAVGLGHEMLLQKPNRNASTTRLDASGRHRSQLVETTPTPGGGRCRTPNSNRKDAGGSPNVPIRETHDFGFDSSASSVTAALLGNSHPLNGQRPSSAPHTMVCHGLNSRDKDRQLALLREASHSRPQSSPCIRAETRDQFPKFTAEHIDAFVADKSRSSTHLPNLRTHLQISKLLKGDEYKRVIHMVNDCLCHAAACERDKTQKQADIEARVATMECSLVGLIDDARVRQVLLLWIIGTSLEVCHQPRPATLFFSRCVELDPTNPVHAYHRGVCLLQVKKCSAAYGDLNLAVSLVLERGQRPPPVAFLANRALAGAALPGRMAEVWADFELTRQSSDTPHDLPVRLMSKRIDSWDTYRAAISNPVPPAGAHRHWVAVLVSRCFKNVTELERPTDNEVKSFARFIRSLKGLSSISVDVAGKNLQHFSTRQIEEGRVVLLHGMWFCILDGTVDVIRFGHPEPPGELHHTLLKNGRMVIPASQLQRLAQDDSADPLSIPSTLEEIPELKMVETLHKQATFQSGDLFGPHGDGWLVAGQGGVELLCLKQDQMKVMLSRCKKQQAQIDAEVALLKKCTLFKTCPEAALLSMITEILERGQALCGEDPLFSWQGLIVIRKGEIELWADASAPGSSAGSRPSSSSLNAKTPHAAEEVHKLGVGDVLGAERILGGQPTMSFKRSRVLSHSLEVWILPADRCSDVEDLGVMPFLREQREAERRDLRDRADAINVWTRHRPLALAQAQRHTRTIDYVRGEVDPRKPICGGGAPMFSNRFFV